MTPRVSPALLLGACLLLACAEVDYDIAEVASPAYLGLEEEHDHEHSAEHSGTEATTMNPYPLYDASTLCIRRESPPEELVGAETDSEMCIHASGERNHGTEWFFNQPWAASFIWGKILRDSLILLVLAGGILLLSHPASPLRRRR